MISQKLNNMKKSTAAFLAALLIAGCGADVYLTHQAEIKAMQDDGAAKLAAAIDMEQYREPEKEQITAIIENTEAEIRESEDQAEIDAMIEKAVAETADFKTDAVYSMEEDGIAKLEESIDLTLYREAEQKKIQKILDSTEDKIRESEDKDEIASLVKKAVKKTAEFKTDAEYTAEEEAARQAAAAAASKKSKKKSKKRSSSQGCIGTGSDVFN